MPEYETLKLPGHPGGPRFNDERFMIVEDENGGRHYADTYGEMDADQCKAQFGYNPAPPTPMGRIFAAAAWILSPVTELLSPSAPKSEGSEPPKSGMF